MVIQIAFGIFFGFLFLAILAVVLFGVSYIISKPPVPKYLKEPKTKTNIQDWWDRYEEDDY